jgi:hypothetical protein
MRSQRAQSVRSATRGSTRAALLAATYASMSGENVDEPTNRSLRGVLHELEKGLGRGFLDVTRFLHDSDLAIDVGGQRGGTSRDRGNRHIQAIGTRLENMNQSRSRSQFDRRVDVLTP